MSYGAQSMVAALRRVLLVPPPAALDAAACRRAGWLSNDEVGLHAQFERFVALLLGLGVEVHLGAAAPADNPDAIYAFDGVFVTRGGAILLRPAKPNRVGEPAARAVDLARLQVPVLGGIEPPGTVDGGDLLWLSESLVVVGLGWRTNTHGADQLAALCRPLGVAVECVDLPNYRGPAHCLHLLSLISPVAPGLAVVAEEMLPVRLVRLLEAAGIERIPSPAEEFDSLGTNVLALGAGEVIALSGNPVTVERMRARGLQVHVLDAPDLCVAGTGGPTCLTQALWRSELP